MKRTTYIIIGIVVLAVIVLLIFWFFFRGNQMPAGNAGSAGSLPSTGAQQAGSDQTGTNGGSLETPSETASTTSGGFGLTSNETVFNYFVDAENNIFAIEPSGEIAEVVGGQATYLSSSAVSGLIEGGFSYDGTMALVNFGDVDDPQSSVFTIATKSWTPLPEGIIAPQWSPADYRIAYLTSASTTETLSTLDVSKTNAKPTALITLSARDLSLEWLNENQIILFDKPSAYTSGSAWLFDLQKKTLAPIIIEWPGFEAAWTGTLTGSTTPMGLVFQTTASARGGTLSLVNISSDTVQNLTFLTLPSKCVFNQELPPVASSTASAASSTDGAVAGTSLALYCAVPTDQNAFSSARLPDDYNQMSLFTSDEIYRIDTSNGTVSTLLAGQVEPFDATDLRVFNDILFFVNRYDQKLYAISL